MSTLKMRISCRRCQLRKLKCTRIQPCGNCTASASECTFRDDDSRRRPVSRKYVTALEEKIASYETALRELQEAAPGKHDEILDATLENRQKISAKVSSTPRSPEFDYTGSSRLSTSSLQPGPEGSLSFFGPTSIYQKECITANSTTNPRGTPHRRFEQWQDFRLSRTLGVPEITVNDGLSKFFFYLNSECIFIDQELFTDDFMSQMYHDRNWSYPLLYTLASLGSRLGATPENMQSSHSLSRCAHEMLSIKCLESPDITVVQSLFGLAYVELGSANHTKGWMLSGMACRMAQDMGLHQDPRFLAGEDSSISVSADILLRRRVYWGCYISDKVISLYFGRPMMLRDNDGAVDLIEDPKNISHTEASQSTRTGELGIISILAQFVSLTKIIERVIVQVFSTKFIKTPRKELVTQRVASVEDLNMQLFKWQSSIQENLTWSQWTTSPQALNPQIAVLHALYHSTLIALNRHFIRPTPGFARRSQSREICISSAESIIAIIRQYRAQHNLNMAPVTLVYSTIMAATAVSFVLDSSAQGAMKSEREKHMKFLLKALKEFATVYPIAADSSSRLEAVLQREGQNKPPTATESIHPGHTAQLTDADQGTGSLFEWIEWEDLPLSWVADEEIQDATLPGQESTEKPAFHDEQRSLS